MRLARSLIVVRPILAHQGGWDEALLIFGVPVVLFFVMRVLAGRRRPDGRDKAD